MSLAEVREFVRAFDEDADNIAQIPCHEALAKPIGVVRTTAIKLVRKVAIKIPNFPAFVVTPTFEISLRELLASNRFTKDIALRVLKNVHGALTFLHATRNSVSGAVCAENVMLNLDNGAAKDAVLQMFGFKEVQKMLDGVRRSRVISASSSHYPYYAQSFRVPAPENLDASSRAADHVFTKSCDIWNFGILCPEILTDWREVSS